MRIMRRILSDGVTSKSSLFWGTNLVGDEREGDRNDRKSPDAKTPRKID
jgi:hypothetical protein